MAHPSVSPPVGKRGLRLAIPFLTVLTVIGIAGAIIPLRPTVSYIEKRKLAEFPAFSAEALISGSYFSDIATWYSDTFPGRESWLQASQLISSLHGYGDISVDGDLPMQVEAVPEIPVATRPPATEPPAAEASEEAATEAAAEIPEETEEATISDQFEDTEVVLDDILSNGTVFQMGDFAFYPVGFSETCSNRYIDLMNKVSASMKTKGVRVVSCPPLTAVSVRVDPKYLSKLRSSDQGQILEYLHGSMSEDVVTVNVYDALNAHKDEYLFFNTDHHWTALGAYYAYAAACEAMGLESAPPIEEFEVLDQGDFRGSIVGRCSNPLKLATDRLYAYAPKDNIILNVCSGKNREREYPLFRDMTNQNINSKYSCFLAGDSALVHLVNNDHADDDSVCLIIKDSFGNCLVPYFALNYLHVYAMDYRKYREMSLSYFVDTYGVKDLIFAANMMSIQAVDGVTMLEARAGYSH